MPYTKFQEKVLQLLAKNRNPESYLAGGTAINREGDSLRYSRDLDIFHDALEQVAICSKADIETLQNAGYNVEVLIRQPGFVQAIARFGKDELKLDWAVDSAFRFYPVEADKSCGYRLHDADLATNKCLALASRSEVRDVLDLIQINDSYLSLEAVCWAACGKDQGYTPAMILDAIKRNSRFTKDDLDREHLAKEINLIELKQRWTELLKSAEESLQAYPADKLGCLFIDKSGHPHSLKKTTEFSKLKPHFGSARGAWPRLA
ncbi:MAG: hypothetical protein IT292_05555 [Deltaproteobacteria bacterium]|nr:hypothetical protein [Deltaproteobacteria bacterium]